jgi:hypothetical protein
MNAINPVAAPAEEMPTEDKADGAAAPKQPFASQKKPAAPGKAGSHYATPARPGM